jgi:hypothetical protein
MALVVQCYHCHSRLELDDGFRGGVCRCSKCGSLLKVPSTAGATDAGRARPADPGSRPPGSRPRDPNEDPGLSASGFRDQSAQRPAVPPSASSGAFSSSSMRPDKPRSSKSGHPAPQPAVPDTVSGMPQSPMITRKVPPVRPIVKKPPAAAILPDKGNNVLLWTLAGFIILFVLATVVVLIVVFSHHHTPAAPAQSHPPAPAAGPATPSTHAGFLGIALTGQKIIFSLDGSSANLDSFNLVAACVKQAVAKLSPQQRVKFVLWKPKAVTVIPENGWLNPLQAAGAQQTLLHYSPYGSTSATNAMTQTLKLGGDQIIFVTAKVFLTNAHLPGEVAKLRTHGQHIDVISINGERKELQKLAQQAKGQFRFISVSDLQNALGQ